MPVDLDRYRILIVEDERIIAYDIEFMLRDLGYKVVKVVSTGEDAVTQALLLKPDLILMDIKLKGDKDGIETAQRIRENLNVPIIFVSAYSDEATMKKLLYQSFDSYIAKPFGINQLSQKINMILKDVSA